MMTVAVRSEWSGAVVVASVALVAYVGYRTFRPLRYADRRNTPALVFDLVINLAAVLVTGAWSSPFVFGLLTPVVAAAYAEGFTFSGQIAGGSSLLVTIPHISAHGITRLPESIQWTAELLLVAFLAGYARRLFGEVQQQHTLALDRVHSLGQANALLAALHGVAQTLPASLDMNEVLSSTVDQLRELVDFDVVVLLMLDEATSSWSVAAAEGTRVDAIPLTPLPPSLQVALSGSAVWLEPGLSQETGPGLDAFSRSGLYAPVRARGSLLGLIALEHREPDHFARADVEMLSGFLESASLAIDNARWFGRLRTAGAHEERNRIARELHDRVGQSLAYLGIQLDRLVTMAGDHTVQPELVQLRSEVRGVIGEVRETLFDLRTDVSASRGIVPTITAFLDRLETRAGVDVNLRHSEHDRLNLRQEREMWRIAQEAMTNAERHAGATSLEVEWDCDTVGALLVVSDDGRGFNPALPARPDAYGLMGMRERADAIGATLEIESQAGCGTTVRCRLERW